MKHKGCFSGDAVVDWMINVSSGERLARLMIMPFPVMSLDYQTARESALDSTHDPSPFAMCDGKPFRLPVIHVQFIVSPTTSSSLFGDQVIHSTKRRDTYAIDCINIIL